MIKTLGIWLPYSRSEARTSHEPFRRVIELIDGLDRIDIKVVLMVGPDARKGVLRALRRRLNRNPNIALFAELPGPRSLPLKALDALLASFANPGDPASVDCWYVPQLDFTLPEKYAQPFILAAHEIPPKAADSLSVSKAAAIITSSEYLRWNRLVHPFRLGAERTFVVPDASFAAPESGLAPKSAERKDGVAAFTQGWSTDDAGQLVAVLEGLLESKRFKNKPILAASSPSREWVAILRQHLRSKGLAGKIRLVVSPSMAERATICASTSLVLAHTTANEPFPPVFQEALSSNAAVLLCNTPGVREQVPEHLHARILCDPIMDREGAVRHLLTALEDRDAILTEERVLAERFAKRTWITVAHESLAVFNWALSHRN